MTATSQKTLLFSALKAVLKERGITYRDVAKSTQMSESSVKRIFSQEECSLTRLTEILAAADITLNDLMEFASQRHLEIETFSLETEEFFATSMDYFFIYRKLFHHRDVDEVRRREKLTSAQMTRYLKKLDELGIIKWLPGDRIQFLQTEYFKFRDDGPLREAIHKTWVPKLHKSAIEMAGAGNHTLKVFSARCTPQLSDDFLREFGDLVDRFFKRASLEIKTQPSNVRPFAVSLATAPLRVGLDEWDND